MSLQNIKPNIDETLKMLNFSKHTGSLLWTNRDDVSISFSDGKIVAAQFGSELGIRALAQWMHLPRYNIIISDKPQPTNISSDSGLLAELASVKRHRQLQDALVDTLWHEQNATSIVMCEHGMIVSCDPDHDFALLNANHYGGLFTWLENAYQNDTRLVGGKIECVEITTAKGNTYLCRNIEGSWLIVEPQAHATRELKTALKNRQFGVWS